MTLGERIKQSRKSKGLRQEEFARILEIPVSTLANYENNHREPRVEMLIKISEALNIPIGGLITIEPIEKIEKEIYLKAINTFGENQQIIKAIEELGELSTALARHFTKNESSANINEEIADVEIMISQLRLIFSNAEIDHHKKEKLERLKGVVW